MDNRSTTNRIMMVMEEVLSSLPKGAALRELNNVALQKDIKSMDHNEFKAFILELESDNHHLAVHLAMADYLNMPCRDMLFTIYAGICHMDENNAPSSLQYSLGDTIRHNRTEEYEKMYKFIWGGAPWNA